MKSLRLSVHQENFSKEPMVINPKDFPDVKVGDVFEIFQPENQPKLLLQVTELNEDTPGKDSISISQTVVSAFQLRSFTEVFVTKVDPLKITLDQVELVFKDQYLSRSDMWRLQEKYLVNTCVYLNKKIEFQNCGTRPQILNMWRNGQNVACGYVSSSTKIVHRSLTGLVNIFIQMSSEMWELNNFGDLHFEVAVDGFLSDLCEKWTSIGSHHDVTIVYFSRVFYNATYIEDFPLDMCTCIQVDQKGRFYEDFYRVIVQNMRSDVLGKSLQNLKKEFNVYQDHIFNLHTRKGIPTPKAFLSTAAQGNFLEVLNLNLNVFEKHYIDRNFDRSGLIGIVVSPGVGVFEVEQELANITKQRAIDTGIATDLVCLGDQPLHAVPLFQFPLKISPSTPGAGLARTDYAMPHWLNLSFYANNIMAGYKAFIPRIKPPKFKKDPVRTTYVSFSEAVKNLNESDPVEDEAYCDEFDSQVFGGQSKSRVTVTSQKGSQKKKFVLNPHSHNPSPATAPHSYIRARTWGRRRRKSDSESSMGGGGYSLSCSLPLSEEMGIPLNRKGVSGAMSWKENESHLSQVVDVDSDEMLSAGRVLSRTSSAGSQKHGSMVNRTLVNPFDPSHLTIPLTSSRRRWSHIFPKGPEGVLIQQHHQHDPTVEEEEPSSDEHDFFVSNKNTLLLWGPTGEQKWSPSLSIKVDWKALIIPACLPITTDYFPDRKSLQNDYVLSDYNLLPEDVNSDLSPRIKLFGEVKRMSTEAVFQELICQRLQQGFQLIVPSMTANLTQSNMTNPLISSKKSESRFRECFLSLGRIFHKLTLSGSTITVTRYRPRHSYHNLELTYRYRYLDNYNARYQLGSTTFSPEFIENYNWNYLDHYICTRGDRDFQLIPSLKYWRSRFLIIPLFMVHKIKKVLESEQFNFEDKIQIEELSKKTIAQAHSTLFSFFETALNKIKATNICRKKKNLKADTRDRLCSNVAMERPRVRLASKASKDLVGVRSGVGKSSSDSSPENKDPNTDSTEEHKVNVNSPLPDISVAMRDAVNGIPLFNSYRGLPNGTFISAEAVSWMLDQVEGLESEVEAVRILQGMQTCGLVCHASGDKTFPFLYGFYFYFLVPTEVERKEMEKNCDASLYKPINDLVEFQRMWMEVGVVLSPADKLGQGRLILSSTLMEDLKSSALYQEQCQLKSVADMRVTDIDFPSKSDRYEWCHVDYHSTYRLDVAYDMTIKWMAASGNVLGDMLTGWSRKTQFHSMFCIVPAPSNPFPRSDHSKELVDPFRCPIFIPLNASWIMSDGKDVFQDLDEDTRSLRLHLLQECILSSFGFMACSLKEPALLDESPSQTHHVHASGYMLVMISPGVGGSAREDQLGFYWTWNYTFSKKLKMTFPIEDSVLLNFLKDFEAFCDNDGSRLQRYFTSLTGREL